MIEAEKRINVIEAIVGNSSDALADRAEVLALCEIARQLARLGDLYLTDLILHGALGQDTNRPDSAARVASQTFLRSEYDDAPQTRNG